MCGANLLKLQNELRRVVDVYVSPNISGIYLKWRNPHLVVSCMDTAYVREFSHPPK